MSSLSHLDLIFSHQANYLAGYMMAPPSPHYKDLMANLFSFITAMQSLTEFSSENLVLNQDKLNHFSLAALI